MTKVEVLKPETSYISSSQGEKLNIVWQQPLQNDTFETTSFTPIVAKNNVLFSDENSARGERIIMLNGTSGEQLWEWQEHLRPSISSYSNSKFLTKKQLVYATGNDTYLVNLATGETEKQFEIENDCGSSRITVINNNFFQGVQACKTANSISQLTQTNLKTEKSRTIYSRKKINNYSPRIEPPGFWLNPNGDTILIFQIRSFDFSKLLGKVDLIAYNINQDSALFEITNLEANSNVSTPLIWNNKIYFQGAQMLFCIDNQTGATIWKRRFFDSGENLLTSNLLIEENKLFVNPGNRNLYALDPQTGRMIWKIQDSGSNCSDMVYHQGIIYFTSLGRGLLYAIEGKTGKQLWAEKSPNRKSGFQKAVFGRGGIAVNEKLGLLYVSDGFFALAAKLVESQNQDHNS